MTAGPRRLPGDPSAATLVERMIRVDQAGEYGAKRIYAGQLAVLGRSAAAPVIRRMAEQEERHLAVFDALMGAHRVRPTLLSPLWHVAGYALGAATALLGERAAMACTVAVEEVIDEHYGRQSETLGESEPELKAAIDSSRRDEREHRAIALAQGAEAAPAYPALSTAIKAGSRLAIWLSTRI
ncbi:MAG TPA: demethoxyubiquinone hydroxylase family protein [Stellaceae bacterium]|nr:demethoxyubiquinone hydroxylase family protein [Stellaceae bacterium]